MPFRRRLPGNFVSHRLAETIERGWCAFEDQDDQSVSGGSITNGVLAMAWPRLIRDINGVFTNFEELVDAPLRKFCGTNIRSWPLLWSRLWPSTWWRRLIKGESATNILADTYANKLFGDLRLQHLSEVSGLGGPSFVFCGTNYQVGVNFEFNDVNVGDYQIGYTPGRNLRLAAAVASSSAFPIAFPPLVLNFDPEIDKFERGKLKGHPDYEKLTTRVLVTDGGVYDNMGLEPVWKDHTTVFCSDGGGPYSAKASPGRWLLPRLTNSQSIINNQARAVRKRWLIGSFEDKDYDGSYWGLTTDIANYKAGVEGYRGKVLSLLAKVRTDLDSFSEGEQLVLMNHGWALTNAALRSHFPAAPIVEGSVPSRELLSNEERRPPLFGTVRGRSSFGDDCRI